MATHPIQDHLALQSKLSPQQRHRRPRRRGVVLLVVLSLLVLFVIIGLTFTLVASVYRKSSDGAARSADREDDLLDEVDRAMYLILRGANHATPFAHQNILEDIYGGGNLANTVGGPLQTTIANIATQMGGEMLLMELDWSAANISSNKFSGCVLTVINGLAKNRSYRVVNSSASGANQIFLLLTPTSTIGSFVRQASNGSMNSYQPSQGDRVLLTRRPFSGLGAGYLAGNMTDQGDTTIPNTLENWLAAQANQGGMAPPYTGSNADVNGLKGVPAYLALMPNYSAYVAGLRDGTNSGMNEDWDAPDFQNMFLAWMPPTATAADQIIPSFHRPALVRYWFHWLRANVFVPNSVNAFTDQWLIFDNPMNGALGAWNDNLGRQRILELKRRIIFRPLPEDHPGMLAANPNFTLAGFGAGISTTPPPSPVPPPPYPRHRPEFHRYDVDNRGTGLNDSNWMDPQFPIKKTLDGRLYKTLIAPLIVDLDQRANVNAIDSIVGNTLSPNTRPYPASVASDLNRVGSGLGPAEIELLVTNANGILTGRYGADGVPGRTLDDLLSYFDNRSLPPRFGQASIYNSAFDMFGRRRTLVDVGGHPIVNSRPPLGTDTLAMLDALRDDINDEYEKQLLDRNAQDTLYSAADMEGVMRRYDHDERIQSKRLVDQLTSPTEAAVVTTHSMAVPIPATAGSLNLLQRSREGGSTDLDPTLSYITLEDLFRDQIINNRGWVRPLTAAQLTALDNELEIVMAPELRRAEPMDVNRPFGNGRDDEFNMTATLPAWAFNAVVDEYDEILRGDGSAYPNPYPEGNVADTARVTTEYNVGVNLRNNDPLGAGIAPGATLQIDHNTPQQIFARHLFCLAMLMVDQDYEIPFNLLDTRNETGGLPLGVTPNLNQSTAGNQRELTVQRIAQWAVNVADFRDPDSTMTVFEYDVNPWDGWSVDGMPRTLDRVGPAPQPPHPDRRIVVGLESPELALTEAGAFHDVAERDTDKDESGNDTMSMPNADTDDDQFRPPTSSLFFELLCIRSPAPINTLMANNAELPSGEMYVRNGSRVVLNVGQVSPARADGVTYPVWRIAITDNHYGTRRSNSNYPRSYDPNWSAKTRLNQDYFYESSATNYGMEHNSAPFDGRPLPAANNGEVPFERFVWMTPGLDPQTSALGEIQRGTFGNLRGGDFNMPAGVAGVGISPGQYLVIAPRPITSVGALEPMPGDPSSEGGSLQQMRVNNNLFESYNLNGAATGPGTTAGSRANTQEAIAIIAERQRMQSIDPQNGANVIPWTNNTTRYAGLNITDPLPTSAGVERLPQPNPSNDLGVVPNDAYMDIYGTSTTEYTNSGRSDVLTDTPFRDRPNNILNQYGMDELRTHQDVRTAHLQRLANPLLPWNPLPTTSGSSFDDRLPVNPYVTVDWISIDCTVFSGDARKTPSATYRFRSGQKGVNNSASNRVMKSPWWPETVQPDTTSAIGAVGAGNSFMRHNLHHTLGFLNHYNLNVDVPVDSPAQRRAATTPGDPYEGYPTTDVFPWIKINNRPFASAYEMMQVPWVGPARIGQEFSVRTGTGNDLDYMNRNVPNNYMRPYGHLFNFQIGGDVAENRVAPNDPSRGLNLFRIFDFLHTPSPFVDTKKWINPTDALAANFYLKPPYNRLLRFREPGKINLNTIPVTSGTNVSATWNALTARFPDWQGAFPEFLASRHGFVTPSFYDNSIPYLPTRFANPFRSSMAAAHMPPIPMGGGLTLQQSEVNASMFRSRPGFPDEPLFRVLQPGTNSRDVDRHAAFAHEGLQRLQNLTTHRSNVFAVWITTGYFEVTKNPPAPWNENGVDSGHLDGYQIQKELGSDTGEIKRHRAFYIIDRSIPVGFEIGKNHNVDDAILLRRIIE